MANKKTMRFFLLDTSGDLDDENLCVLNNFVDGLEMEDWRVGKGEHIKDVYPKHARIYMDKRILASRCPTSWGTHAIH